jgi:hypothetical protein
MTGHGGKRKNAGRKLAEPSLYERLAIGARCEELRNSAAENTALIRSKMRRPELKKVRELQSTIRAGLADRAAAWSRAVERRKQGKASGLTVKTLRQDFERYQTRSLARLQNEVAPILDRIGRHVDLSKFTPARMRRPDVCREVAREYLALGRPEITPRRVKAYWTEYGNFLKTSHST